MANVATLRISDNLFNDAVRQLGEFVAIRSLSNPNSSDYNMSHLQAAANFASGLLEKIGFKAHQIRTNNSAPYVVAERIVDLAKPTLLLYAHYDVQPVERDKWIGDPFIMQERDGRLYGRGTADDKGGIIGIVAALGAYLKTHKELPVNIKILFEGEEEYGSSNMKKFIDQNAERLRAHALIILDGGNRDVNTGSLTSSTRGIVNIKLTVNALTQPVHSGKGCIAPDPAAALAGVVATLFPASRIPGFLNGHVPVTAEEKKLLDESSETAQQYSKSCGVCVPGDHLRGDSKESIYKRIVDEPSISVLNMTAGKPNGGNSIPASAECDVGVRVLAGQDPKKVSKAVVDYLRAQPVLYNLPLTATIMEDNAKAWKGDITNPFASKYLEVLKSNFGKSCVMPTGGTLPLLGEFDDAFEGKMKMMISAVADDRSAIHSHNESQDVKVLRQSIDSLMQFLDEAAKIKVERLPEASQAIPSAMHKAYEKVARWFGFNAVRT